jgi:hypothetical protein
LNTTVARRTRRFVAPLTATLLTFLSVAVPLLDRPQADSGAVIESEHHTGTCVRGHDHTICAQAGANLSLPAAMATPTPASHLVSTRAPRLRQLLPETAKSFDNRSRAPPHTLA